MNKFHLSPCAPLLPASNKIESLSGHWWFSPASLPPLLPQPSSFPSLFLPQSSHSFVDMCNDAMTKVLSSKDRYEKKTSVWEEKS